MPVIDHHDDLCESFLSAIDPDAVGEIMKISSWKESADLLDRDFALIIVDDEGKEHRKFACFDPGNALMSEWYLLNAEHELGDGAVKVAAANIASALEHFGLEPTPATVYLADQHAGEDARRVKLADAMRGYGPSASPMTAAGGATIGAVGGAATGARMGGIRGAIGGALGGGMLGGAAGKYTQTVKAASAFDVLNEVVDRWDYMDYYDKHSVAVDLVKEASVVGASVPDYIYQYSGTELNPRFEKIASDRANFTAKEELQEGYRRLAKMASAMNPDDVVEAMHLLDEQAGLYHRYGDRIPDPLLSVYGITKEAEYSWIQGADYVTEGMLKRYAGSYASNRMEDTFTEEIKDKFRANPVEVFKSMPDEQKLLVARLASQSRDTNNGGY